MLSVESGGLSGNCSLDDDATSLALAPIGLARLGLDGGGAQRAGSAQGEAPRAGLAPSEAAGSATGREARRRGAQHSGPRRKEVTRSGN